jgi:DNA replication protein DnaC
MNTITEATEATVASYMKELRLPTMVSNLSTTLRTAEEQGHPPIEVLRALLEMELDQRRINQTRRRIREAKFPYVKGLDSFDFSAIPSMNKSQVLSLARCDYVDKRRSLIMLGNSGTGKTHLAIALGREACQRGYRVRFYTGAGLVNELSQAQHDYTMSRFEKRWLKWDLVILDEVG